LLAIGYGLAEEKKPERFSTPHTESKKAGAGIF
jgi:hypothetical protein